MKRRLHLVSLLMALATNALAATPACQFSTEASGTQKIGPWINKSNWLNIENQRLSLHSSATFMPSLRLPGGGTALAVAPRAVPFDALETTDPLDAAGMTWPLCWIAASAVTGWSFCAMAGLLQNVTAMACVPTHQGRYFRRPVPC